MNCPTNNCNGVIETTIGGSTHTPREIKECKNCSKKVKRCYSCGEHYIKEEMECEFEPAGHYKNPDGVREKCQCKFCSKQ